MKVLEHWWNGTWGSFVRRDLWLQISDDGIWQLRVRWSTYPERTFDYRDESDARTQLELLLSENGPWKQVS